MKIISATFEVNGKKVRRPIVLSQRPCKICGEVFQPKSQRSVKCENCLIASKRLTPEQNRKYKDKIRHGEMREELLEKDCGLTCFICGKECKRSVLITHHIMYDAEDHEKQVNLCRSCHAIEHYDERTFGEAAKIRREVRQRINQITKRAVVNALKQKTLEEAADFLGISRGALWKLRKVYGLPKRSDGRKNKKWYTYR